MTSQQHLNLIRKISQARGLDPLSGLRAASAARQLESRIQDGDIVLWPESAGGIAWEALRTNKPSPTRGSSFTLVVVFGPGGPANPGMWKNFSKVLAGRSIILELLEIEETPCHNAVNRFDPETAAAGNADSTVSSGGFLEFFLRLFGSRKNASGDSFGNAEPPPPETGHEDHPGSPALTPLEDVASISRIPQTVTSIFDNDFFDGRDDMIRVDTRCPLEERFLLSECAARIALLPVMTLREGEQSRALVFLMEMRNRHLPVAISMGGPWGAWAVFRTLKDFPVLSPATAADTQAALLWIRKNGGSALLIEPDNYPERNVFKTSWETGCGVIARESLKGSAGHLLLVVPGKYAGVASKAADRLVKDNISVTVLSMRFLNPLDMSLLFEQKAKVDMTIVAEMESFAGDLRSSLVLQLIEAGFENVVPAPAGLDSGALAELGARELREQRILRTVDDVKADRWR